MTTHLFGETARLATFMGGEYHELERALIATPERVIVYSEDSGTVVADLESQPGRTDAEVYRLATRGDTRALYTWESAWVPS